MSYLSYKITFLKITFIAEAALIKIFGGICFIIRRVFDRRIGRVDEWFKSHAWKACLGE
jgi:hypothetical protein